jgi:hypothetical protein
VLRVPNEKASGEFTVCRCCSPKYTFLSGLGWPESRPGSPIDCAVARVGTITSDSTVTKANLTQSFLLIFLPSLFSLFTGQCVTVHFLLPLRLGLRTWVYGMYQIGEV